MKKYKFKAKNFEGKIIEGIVEAVNVKEAARILREKQLITISVSERGKSRSFNLVSNFLGVGAKDVTEFTRQLSTMVASGLTLTNSLSLLREQAKPAMEKILTDLVKEIEGGSSFNQALAKYPNIFSKTYIALIKSGEASGALDRVLKRMADSLEKTEEFKGKVKGAMIYPAIVVIGMVAVVTIMMIYVIPKLTEMYKDFGADMPASTQLLIGISNFAVKFWYIILAGIIGGVYALQMWRGTSYGREKIDNLILKIPLLGKLRIKIILTDTARTLSMLLSAGVAIIDSLNIVAEAANNAVFEKALIISAKDVEKGLPLTATFERFDIFPPLFSQMVAVGEETGKLDEVLEKVAKQFEMEAELAVKALTTSLEPLMMVVLGIGVGFIIFSVITPIYNLTAQF